MIYRIRNWDDLYENHRTRELNRMTWLPLPNKMDGDGYTLLLSQENGAALLGAWVATLQIASRCAPRGTLVREGGVPHDASSLGRISRVPASTIQQMLDLCSSDIGWIDVEGDLKGENPIPRNPAQSRAENGDVPRIVATDRPLNGHERNGTEHTLPAPMATGGASRKRKKKSEVEFLGYLPEFEIFWTAYPRKIGKFECFQKWLDVKPVAELQAQILQTLEKYKATESWKKDGGQYIPHPTTWLNQRRWEDDPTALVPPEFQQRAQAPRMNSTAQCDSVLATIEQEIKALDRDKSLQETYKDGMTITRTRLNAEGLRRLEKLTTRQAQVRKEKMGFTEL